MHQLIHGLVYDSSPLDAVETAKEEVFQPLVREDIFDYFVTFEEDGRGVSGRDRWGDYPAAVPAETDWGEEILEQGWDATVDEYRRSFDRVREFFENHETQDFWVDGDVHREYSFDFQKIGEYSGVSTFLYAQGGEGIRTEDRLNSILEEDIESANPEHSENQELYVVPADVHY